MFWLNRGEFTRYQENRQKLMLPKEKTLEDQRLGEEGKTFDTILNVLIALLRLFVFRS